MSEKIKIDNQYTSNKDNYTYRQILIGLRNEFLEFQKKLDQLSEYVFIFEDTEENRQAYYFNLYKNPFHEELPELTLDREIIKKSLLEKLRLIHSATRAFMVKSSNGKYYPLKKTWFKEKQFNMVIKPGCEKEFLECAEEILNSDFAKYMQLSSTISASVDNSNLTPVVISPKISSFGFDLRTSKSEFGYLGRNNMLCFRSVRKSNEKWEPLTQEHLNFVSGIEFPKDAFPEYHQSIIDRSIDDDRPIILSEDYQPEILTKFEIQDLPMQLVLTKTKSKRAL